MATARIKELWQEMWGEFWLAATFLTTIPAPSFVFPAGGLGRSARLFPLIGLVIGLLLWAVQSLAGYFFSPLLTGALVVLAWVIVTGGLHLDGLADCCDGLLATTSRERRLEIIRDPRVGAFGALGLIVTLMLKTLTVANISPIALLLAPVWARWLLLWVATQPQARPEGMGASFAAGITPEVIAVGLIVPLVVLLFGGGHGLAGVLMASLASVGLVRLAKQRIGGVTGDLYGLVVEVSEVLILLAFAAQPNWG